QVSPDEDFAEPFFDDDQLTQTTHQVDSLLYEIEYFWRVRGQNNLGIGLWSDVFRFTTQDAPFPPDSVALVAPADSAINQPTTLTFQWEAATFANRYHLQVSADSAFSDIVYENDQLRQVNEEVAGLDELTTYFWRVLAANQSGESPWSQTRRLTTVPPLPGLVPPIAPRNNVVGVSPTLDLSWGAIPLTDRYHLQVATAFNFSGIVYNVDTLTTTTQELGPLEVKRKYFWRVRGINAAGDGPWMVRQRFTTGKPPGVVALVAPGDGVVDEPSTIHFQWQADADAVAYHLQVSTDSSFSQRVFDNDQLTQTSHDFGPLAYLTTHFWRVRGINSASPGPWSTLRSFTVAVGTAIEQLGEAIPEHYALHPNYPNPFNPQTTLRFDLPEAVPVSLVIYDLLGRVVETLIEDDLSPGQYSFVWQAADRPSGLYLAHLKAGSFSQTRKLILMK
ncbi:MAG: T9SS type A sorting domain-containing protein, partial [Rhodothermales bacterium]